MNSEFKCLPVKSWAWIWKYAHEIVKKFDPPLYLTTLINKTRVGGRQDIFLEPLEPLNGLCKPEYYIHISPCNNPPAFIFVKTCDPSRNCMVNYQNLTIRVLNYNDSIYENVTIKPFGYSCSQK